jgi:hypothetical protein
VYADLAKQSALNPSRASVQAQQRAAKLLQEVAETKVYWHPIFCRATMPYIAF